MAQYVDQEGNPLWTIEEAARQWGVSPRRVYKWIKGRAGESKGMYVNRDGQPMRRFSRSERTRLPEGSYALYPVGRRSIVLIRPQPYPEPILSLYARPVEASHPGDRTSIISYEANSANAGNYGYKEGPVSTPAFPDPYSDESAMYAPKRERTPPGDKKQTRRRRTQPVSDVEGRGRRPLATQEETEAAASPEAVKAAAPKLTKKGEAREKKPVAQEPQKPELPFYGFEIFDESRPREKIVSYAQFDDDDRARAYGSSLLNPTVPQYLAISYFADNKNSPSISTDFLVTPLAEQNKKKFPEQVKELLKVNLLASKPGAAWVFPTPTVIGTQAAAQPVEPVPPVQPSVSDETLPEVAVRSEPPPPPAAKPKPKPAAKISPRAINALLRTGSIVRTALTKPPKDFAKLTPDERESGVPERIETAISEEISAGAMPEGSTESENAWISQRARDLLTEYRSQ